MNGEINFTSRSAIEDYRKCPRYRYLRYFYNGKGITSILKSVPLTTGTCVHAGVEYILSVAKIDPSRALNDESVLVHAITAATKLYRDLVFDTGFGDVSSKTHVQNYTYEEQKALTEALIRAWYMKELPLLLEKYEIVNTEREIVIPLTRSIMFQARVDAELRDKEDGSYYNYSLKTTKSWYKRIEDSYLNDLQGVTEIWANEQEHKQAKEIQGVVIANLEVLMTGGYVTPQLIEQVDKYLTRKIPEGTKKIDGVKFCFLLKGDRRKVDPDDKDSFTIQHSPLIRGYKNITPTSIEYAHSFFFNNPNNPSGKGRLGKGWEAFNVWDKGSSEIEVWMKLIDEGKIQPDEGDIIKNQVVTPLEYFRSEGEIESRIRQVREQEKKVFNSVELLKYAVSKEQTLDEEFPQHDRSCHWPTDCEMLAVCYKKEVGEDPIGSGLYQIRIPHHAAEKESLE